MDHLRGEPVVSGADSTASEAPPPFDHALVGGLGRRSRNSSLCHCAVAHFVADGYAIVGGFLCVFVCRTGVDACCECGLRGLALRSCGARDAMFSGATLVVNIGVAA